MRQIICEKNQAALASASDPIAICRNTPLKVRSNQLELKITQDCWCAAAVLMVEN